MKRFISRLLLSSALGGLALPIAAVNPSAAQGFRGGFGGGLVGGIIGGAIANQRAAQAQAYANQQAQLQAIYAQQAAQQAAAQQAANQQAAQEQDARRAEAQRHQNDANRKAAIVRQAANQRAAVAQQAAENAPDNHCREPEVARAIIVQMNSFTGMKFTGVKTIDLEHVTTIRFDGPEVMTCHFVMVSNVGARVPGVFSERPNVAGDTLASWAADR